MRFKGFWGEISMIFSSLPPAFFDDFDRGEIGVVAGEHDPREPELPSLDSASLSIAVANPRLLNRGRTS